MALFDIFRRRKKDRPQAEAPEQTRVESPAEGTTTEAPRAHEDPYVAPQPTEPAPPDEPYTPPLPAEAPSIPSEEALEATDSTAAARAEAEREAATQAEALAREVEEQRRREAEEARARAEEEERDRREATQRAEDEQRAEDLQREEAHRHAALLDGEDSPEVAAERARVEELLASVGPELRTRRIIDLLGVTFGRLAPAGEWGSTTIAFRPARGSIYLQVGTDGPEGGRSGAGSWKPVATFVEILLQELQRSMYEPATGTWLDGRIVYTFRGEREDHRGRPVAPEPEVRVNYADVPQVGAQDAPYSPQEAADFLTRFPRSPEHVPAWLADLARRGGLTL